MISSLAFLAFTAVATTMPRALWHLVGHTQPVYKRQSLLENVQETKIPKVLPTEKQIREKMH